MKKIECDENGVVKKATFNFKFNNTKVVIKIRTKKDEQVEKVFIDGKKIEEIIFPWEIPAESSIFDNINFKDVVEISKTFAKHLKIENDKLVIKDDTGSLIEKENKLAHKDNENFSTKEAQSVLDMLLLQKKLNDETCGLGWEKLGITDEGFEINWDRYMYMESAEFIESYPFKHWKNISVKADIENAQLEIVDIWHFLLSKLLSMKTDNNLLAKMIVEQNFEIKKAKKDILDINNLLLIEHFMKDCLQNSIAKKDKNKKNVNIENITYTFIRIVNAMFENGLNDLTKLYFGKNALNKLRQDYGYKDGTYVKNWINVENNGQVEDNVIMIFLMNKLEDTSIESIYNALEDYYLNMKKIGDLTQIIDQSPKDSSLTKLTLQDVLLKVKKDTNKKYNMGHIKNRAKKMKINLEKESQKDLKVLLDSFL